MNRINVLLLTLICMLVGGIVTAKDKNDGFVIIKGSVEGERKVPVKLGLYQIADGKGKEISLTNLSADKSFGFCVNIPQEGFYTLGLENQRMSWGVAIYLKPGDNLNLVLNADKLSYQLVGKKNSKESVALAKWENYIAEVKLGGVYFTYCNVTYKEIFPKIEAADNGLKAFVANLKTGNEKFDNLLSLKAKVDLDFSAIMLLMTPRTAHAPESEVIPFYRNLNPASQLKTDDILSLPDGAKMANSYIGFYRMRMAKDTPESQLVDRFLGTDRLKGEYYISSVSRIKDYISYENFVDKYSKFMVTPSLKQRMDDASATVANSKAGEKAANFTYPDLNGKMVSLSDFKGKVVFIDVWATWCGPCKGEIPHMHKLEQEFKNNSNIVFMSVSLDEDKNKEEWKKMIKDNDMGGVQLFASGWSKIAKDYKITGIPRFLIINKDGTIYSVDAPRPSNPDLKGILTKLTK